MIFHILSLSDNKEAAFWWELEAENAQEAYEKAGPESMVYSSEIIEKGAARSSQFKFWRRENV